jgi:hypothetical protein
MYIISKKKNKDYYDGVAGTMGIDKTIVYNRERVDIDDERKFPDFITSSKGTWKNLKEFSYYSFKKDMSINYIASSHFIVGFCGKLYVGWKLYVPIKDNNDFGKRFETIITYDVEFMNEILKPCGFNVNNTIIIDVKHIQNYNAIDIFRKYNAPVFVYDADYERTSINRCLYRNKKLFIVNPKLSDYEFYKVFDSVQAFQEISMFIGGVLGNKENSIIQINDKNKIEQHGFDYKWSFRKESKNR